MIIFIRFLALIFKDRFFQRIFCINIESYILHKDDYVTLLKLLSIASLTVTARGGKAIETDFTIVCILLTACVDCSDGPVFDKS
jgi:hypothetical protein